MRRLLFFALLALPFAAQAQTDVNTSASAVSAPVVVAQQAVSETTPFRFGCVAYGEVFQAMPEYAVAQRQIATLEEKYMAETKRVEEEFNAKYEEFLEGMNDFPPTILKKRQTELQEMLDRNIAFKEESRELLDSARNEIFAPIHKILSIALNKIGKDMNLSFIINTDNNSCPFVNPTQGIDVTQEAIRLVISE